MAFAAKQLHQYNHSQPELHRHNSVRSVSSVDTNGTQFPWGTSLHPSRS